MRTVTPPLVNFWIAALLGCPPKGPQNPNTECQGKCDGAYADTDDEGLFESDEALVFFFNMVF